MFVRDCSHTLKNTREMHVLIKMYFIYYYCVHSLCMYVCVYVCVHDMACVWRSEDSSRKLVLSSHHVSPRIEPRSSGVVADAFIH